MSSTYSEYDESEFDYEGHHHGITNSNSYAPPSSHSNHNRSCFRAFITNGNNTNTTSTSGINSNNTSKHLKKKMNKHPHNHHPPNHNQLMTRSRSQSQSHSHHSIKSSSMTMMSGTSRSSSHQGSGIHSYNTCANTSIHNNDLVYYPEQDDNSISNTSGYGLLKHENGKNHHFNDDSFFTSATGKTESTFSGVHAAAAAASADIHNNNYTRGCMNSSSNATTTTTKNRKINNCLHATNDRLLRRSIYMMNNNNNNNYINNNSSHYHNQHYDDNSIHKHSLVGLLEKNSDIIDDNDDEHMMQMQLHHNQYNNFDKQSLHKMTKTTACSSVASSSHKSRTSRTSRRSGGSHHNNYNNHNLMYESFDFIEVDDIKRKSLGKTFIGNCVGMKNTNRLTKQHQGGGDFHNGRTKQNHKSKSTSKTSFLMKERRNKNRNGRQIVEEPSTASDALSSPTSFPMPTEDDNHDGTNHNHNNTNGSNTNAAPPGSPQFFKFHNALPKHTVENHEFPQIIFADADVSHDDDNNDNVGADASNNDNNIVGNTNDNGNDENEHDENAKHFGFHHHHHRHQGNNGFDSRHDQFEDAFISPNTIQPRQRHHHNQQQQYQQEDGINPFFQSNSANNNYVRSPSPIQRRYSSPRKNFDFTNSSPRSTSRSQTQTNHNNNNSNSRNPSPTKSIRSLKEEGQFLDTLANALTAYNSFKKGNSGSSSNNNIKKTMNKHSFVNKLMAEVNMPHIPDVVDVVIKHNDDYGSAFGVMGNGDEHDNYYHADDVSDVGMASTSEGRKYYENYVVEGEDDGPIVDPQLQQQNRGPAVRKDSNDYFDASIKERNNRISKSIHNHNNDNNNNMTKFKQVDERSHKWKLREADRQNSNLSNRNFQQHQLASREFMETGKSLMDREISGSSDEMKNVSIPPSHDNNGYNEGNEEEVDPTYAFGGSGVRKPPLALSEAFEEFGIDDRIYSRKHRPSDTFEVEEEDSGKYSSEQYFEHGFNHKHQANVKKGTHRNDARLEHSDDDDDNARKKVLMNAYIANHHNLHDDIDGDPDAGEEHDTHMMKPKKKEAFAATTYATASSDNYENRSSSSNSIKSRSGPRSSKYKEINGSAYFSESSSTISMQTSKWTNTTKTNNEKAMKRSSMPTIDSEEEDDDQNIKGSRRSPQSIADYDEW